MKQKFSTLRRVSYFLLLMLFTTTVWAQEITVTGRVTSAADGEPLIGVTVVVKGTTIGTSTDVNGSFSIKTKAGSTLVFSYIGYKTIELIADGKSPVNVSLEDEFATLEEIVVIGYGTVKKSDATGSVATVGSKDFNLGAITSPQALLVGKSAGVVISAPDGAPGSGSQIRIRGGSSLHASNDPLIVIDGVPIDNKNLAGSSNFLTLVNPNDIESFTILKDASATAIYGSRASNGVIIITTKKGRIGSPMKVTYDVNTSLSAPMAYLPVYTGDEMRAIAHEYPNLYGQDALDRLGDANTDWQREIFRTALTQDHNLGISGSYKTLPYRASVGYTMQNGILQNTDMQRITAALNLSPTFFNDDLKVNLNAKGMNTHHDYGDYGAVGSAIRMSPTHPIKDDTAPGGYFQWENYGASLGTPNPVEQALMADNKSIVNRFLGNVQLDYRLPFLPSINANLNLATDYGESSGHNNRPSTSPSVLLPSGLTEKVESYTAKNVNNLLDFYLNFSQDLDKISSRIDAMAGYSWQYFKNESESTRRESDPNPSGYITVVRPTINELQLISFFGRLNYSLLDRYLVTFTLRNDHSSRFSPDTRSGFFPSLALAWKINEESFLRDVDLVTDLKFRMGWGETGQQDIMGNYYPYMSTFLESTQGYYYMIDGQLVPTLRPNAYDPKIKWEKTITKNIGFDFGFYNDRITGTVDLYERITEDMINEVGTPTMSNFSNRLWTNVGSLENKGVETSLNVIPISHKDMSLNIGLNFTYNRNKITKLLISDDPDYLLLYGDAFTGQNQVTKVGYPIRSFFVNQQVYDEDGNPIEGLYVDLAGQGGQIGGDNANKYIYKDPSPDYLFGFSFRFNYKQFDIMSSSRISIGNYVYNALAAGASLDQMSQIGYWVNMPTMLDDTRFVKRQFTSDYFVENGSYWKLDYLGVGYNISKIYKTMNARIGFTVQNVLTVTKYKGLDPEVSNGIGSAFYPRPRTFMLGISISY
ncbi:MAG TPA: TonB-dependent receptor [Tenuifilaceae bacterium]|nr:TonB-dependent receptor [Tenuifilaceae bacterium]